MATFLASKRLNKRIGGKGPLTGRFSEDLFRHYQRRKAICEGIDASPMFCSCMRIRPDNVESVIDVWDGKSV
jgi:hypothetical protein